MKTQKYPIFLLLLITALNIPSTLISQPKLENGVVKAVQQGHVPSLAVWIAAGGDINAPANNDNTLLMIASKVGELQMVEYILSQLPNVDAQNKAGTTALILAAKYGHDDVVKILLEIGSDPSIRNHHGITASRFALAFEHYEMYQRLREAELVEQSLSGKANS